MIRVDENYIIEPDTRSYILYFDTHSTRFDKTEKKEVPILNIIGYYDTLSGAIKGILDQKTKISLGKGEYSLHEALNELQRIYSEFEDILLKATSGGH